jgi:hypothetical protein
MSPTDVSLTMNPKNEYVSRHVQMASASASSLQVVFHASRPCMLCGAVGHTEVIVMMMIVVA